MLIKELHHDIMRYLENDCYCPGEVYDRTGFFHQIVKGEDECKKFAEGNGMIACVWHDQVIVWFIDEFSPGVFDEVIQDAVRVDATENNIKLAEDMVNHTATADRKFDEFRPGESKRALEDIMSIADMVIID